MAAYLGVLIVLTVPGALVAYLLRLRLDTLLTWASVPALSLATVFLLGELTAATRVPLGVPAFLVLILALGGAAFAKHVLGHRSRRSDLIEESTQTNVKSRIEERVAYLLLALGIMAGLFVWWHGLRGVPLVLPGADGARHGFAIGRIVHGQSVDVAKVMVGDADGVHQVVGYFPLGGHATAAIASDLTPADVGQVVVALTVLFAAVVLPLGMFVLARHLFPERPLVGGFATLAVPALTLFPYSPIRGGQAFGIMGMAMVPAGVVLVVRSLHGGGAYRRSLPQTALTLAPAALVLVSVASTHSSELVLIVFLAWLLILERAWLERQQHVIRTAFVRSLGIALLMVLLLGPTLAAIVSGGSERIAITAAGVPPGTDWTELFGPILMLRTDFTRGGFVTAFPDLPAVRQIVLAVLAFVGAGFCLRYRRPAWVVGWVTIIVLSLFASTTNNPLTRALTFPWYHGSLRIHRNQAFFVAILAALPLAFSVGAITRILRRQRAVVPATVVTGALFVSLVTFPGYRASWALLRSAFSVKPGTIGNQARVDRSSEAAFQWLDSRTNESDTVINEGNVDSSLWMYPLHGVKPLIGFSPLSSLDDRAAARDVQSRRYLVQHIDQLGKNARVDELVRHYRARWIYYDSRTFPLGTHALNVEALRSNAAIEEVFHSNGVSVFKVNVGGGKK